MSVGKRNSVHVSGSGSATMFFAHGFGCDQNMWRLLEPAYAKRYRTVVFDLVGIVSHDLRNPLSTIQMGTALLTRGELSASQQRAVARISSATEQATRLIADLLDFTQAQVGKGLAVALESIDLHECVAETLEDLTVAYPARRLVH